jgi:hypothetical protein
MTKVFKPEPSIVRTPIDEIGSLLNVDRIAGEAVSSYAERLFGTFIKRSSSTYQGMINGINRALGQEESEIMVINFRAILQGDISKDYIEYSSNYIQNNFSYSGVVNGLNVVAVGDTLTDQNAEWDEESLRGLTLTIGLDKYEIISNTKNSLKIRGLLSDLIGNNFSIQLELIPNVLTGSSIRIDNKNIPIAENTVNKIFINQGVFDTVFSTSFKITAINPRVEVSASSIYLYKEYQSEENFQLEKQISLRNFTKFHTGLVDEINTSYFFEAINLLGHKEKVLSISLKKQSSDIIVTQEIVPAVKYFKLKNQNIKPGSLVFAESSIFIQETEEENVFDRQGNYHVDYNSGFILTSATPSGNRTVSYISSSFPFRVVSSPAIVNTMADKEVEDYLFSQLEVRVYENVKERFVSSQPTTDMLEYIGELLKVKPQAWG